MLCHLFDQLLLWMLWHNLKWNTFIVGAFILNSLCQILSLVIHLWCNLHSSHIHVIIYKFPTDINKLFYLFAYRDIELKPRVGIYNVFYGIMIMVSQIWLTWISGDFIQYLQNSCSNWPWWDSKPWRNLKYKSHCPFLRTGDVGSAKAIVVLLEETKLPLTNTLSAHNIIFVNCFNNTYNKQRLLTCRHWTRIVRILCTSKTWSRCKYKLLLCFRNLSFFPFDAGEAIKI